MVGLPARMGARHRRARMLARQQTSTRVQTWRACCTQIVGMGKEASKASMRANNIARHGAREGLPTDNSRRPRCPKSICAQKNKSRGRMPGALPGNPVAICGQSGHCRPPPARPCRPHCRVYSLSPVMSRGVAPASRRKALFSALEVRSWAPACLVRERPRCPRANRAARRRTTWRGRCSLKLGVRQAWGRAVAGVRLR